MEIIKRTVDVTEGPQPGPYNVVMAYHEHPYSVEWFRVYVTEQYPILATDDPRVFPALRAFQDTLEREEIEAFDDTADEDGRAKAVVLFGAHRAAASKINSWGYKLACEARGVKPRGKAPTLPLPPGPLPYRPDEWDTARDHAPRSS